MPFIWESQRNKKMKVYNPYKINDKDIEEFLDWKNINPETLTHIQTELALEFPFVMVDSKAGVVYIDSKPIPFKEYEKMSGLKLEKQREISRVNLMVFSPKSSLLVIKTKHLLERYYSRQITHSEIFHFLSAYNSLLREGFNRKESILILLTLHKRFGIKHFMRYGVKNLIKQYKRVDWKTGELIFNKARPQLLFFSGDFDDSGALWHSKDYLKSLDKIGYDIFIFEGGKKRFSEAIGTYNNLNNYDLFLFAHGFTDKIILFSSSSIYPTLETISQKDQTLLASMKGKARIIYLNSCSTGLESSPLSLSPIISSLTGAIVISPPGILYEHIDNPEFTLNKVNLNRVLKDYKIKEDYNTVYLPLYDISISQIKKNFKKYGKVIGKGSLYSKFLLSYMYFYHINKNVLFFHLNSIFIPSSLVVPKEGKKKDFESLHILLVLDKKGVKKAFAEAIRSK